MKKNERPCPNCGERGTCIEEYASHYGVGSRYHVTCANCGARGPAGRSNYEAVEAWNRRAGEERLLVLLRRFVDGVWNRALLEEAEAALAETEGDE